jgi:3-phosphoshikimate 1-carboxyvinyltransferase
LLGLLAGQDFGVRLLAGEQLSKRPMLRVTSLLRQMGALIEARRINSEEYPPVFINGGRLKGITYQMRVASAQVKSAILLAGLYASGETKVIESVKTRDHTERMLKFFKARIKLKGNTTVITRCAGLKSPRNIIIPGDFSSAAFFIVAATLLPDSRLRLKGVNLNPTRTGLLKVLKMMGADISINKLDKGVSSPEPVGDIEIRTSRLKAVRVLDSLIPSLIDELPILMVASSLAKGVTVLEGVGELRFKETDRIRSMSENLNKMGGDVRIVKKGIKESVVIRGVRELKPAFLKSFSDHRTAMSLVVAASCLRSKSRIEDLSCINKSFPGFLTLFKSLSGEV